MGPGSIANVVQGGFIGSMFRFCLLPTKKSASFYEY
ncbi:hypothetical protein NSE_0867 [Neorickettsia sennetsu str. Miyayama]|uniref:Uncharacterized protein n=1 Tax=Ehrlichia sennetsu (strain ATCC VR-367 / Miyayama) TaxID=222891 RepID=Q2GCR2_EHRS3|nr:hypothetical protein NSE_0867 [Neorickettsia sennetsu str. Miyayama]